MGTWGLSHPPHSDLCLPGLCPGVLTLAIPLWAPQLSAHTLHLQAPRPLRSISKASAVGVPSLPFPLAARSGKTAHLPPVLCSCFPVARTGPGTLPSAPPIRPSPLTLNTWSSSRTTSSGSAESPAWRAMTLSTEPESEMGEKGSGGEEGAARAPAHSPVRPPYPAHPPVPRKMTS